MLCRTLANEWHCNYILCFFFYVQGWTVGRQSGCAIQCTKLEGCMQPAFFRGWFYIMWMYMHEQNGSSYFLWNILTLTVMLYAGHSVGTPCHGVKPPSLLGQKSSSLVTSTAHLLPLVRHRQSTSSHNHAIAWFKIIQKLYWSVSWCLFLELWSFIFNIACCRYVPLRFLRWWYYCG